MASRWGIITKLELCQILKTKGIKAFFLSELEAMASRWIPSRSKVQDWLLPKLIQLLTIMQIICLVIFIFIIFPVHNRNLMEVSNYLSPGLAFFIKASDYNKIPALVSMVFLNVCLIYCTWMERPKESLFKPIEKPSFDYWKWKEQKAGRCLLYWLLIIGSVSYDLKIRILKVLW